MTELFQINLISLEISESSLAANGILFVYGYTEEREIEKPLVPSAANFSRKLK